MNYIIHTPSATRLKKEILDRVSEKVDTNGKGIVTWQVAETDGSEKVLSQAMTGKYGKTRPKDVTKISERN